MSKEEIEQFKKEHNCNTCTRNIDCKITRRIDNTVKCDNYARCMQNKCNTCKDNNKCFTTARKNKPIMKGISK